MAIRNIKVGETDTELLRAYFDVRLLDLVSPALSEAGGQPEYSINGEAFNPSGITTLTAVSYGRYYASISSALLNNPGDVIRTRYKSSVTTEAFGDTFLVVASDSTLPDDAISFSYYGNVNGGDVFFSNSLKGKKWKASSVDNKSKALVDATRIIDRLNFSGEKASSLQVLQFPRKNTYTDPITSEVTTTTDVNVPDDIKFATYIIADRLLDGWDPDIEADNLSHQSHKYSSVTTNYNREYIPEHMRAGIPSASAWNYIRPYVRDPQEISFTRL